LYETRLEENTINKQTNLIERAEIPNLDYWNGIDKCNRLLIVYEQGIGDNIQYFRFIIELSNRFPNMKIYYFCRNIIFRIFQSYNNIYVFTDDNPINISNYDFKIYIMSLPRILRLDTILPNTENYIRIEDSKMIEWKQRLASLKKYRVGFVYNGLLSSFIEKNIPLSEFEILCDLDIDLICIHKKSEIETDIEVSSLKDKIHYFDIDHDIPFQDTIHILKNIDLLITIDTYIVHLAGVLGLKTWLLLGKYSDWRWSIDEKTYWYESVELIRMKEKDELKNIMPIVKEKLKAIL
jgi:ADP-heptose:LPS heptosyltransferase